MEINEEIDKEMLEFSEKFLSDDEDTEETEGMTDGELISLVRSEVNMIETDAWSQLAEQRIQSGLQFTHVLGNDYRATEGLSNVVFNFTTPAVETLTTYMTKVFCSDKETTVFSPMNPQLEDMAKQASRMVDEVLHKRNNGYKILNRCFKDAAVNKNAIIKTTWDESTTSYEEDLEGLDEASLAAIIAQKEEDGYTVEVISETIEEETIMVPSVDPLTGVPTEIEQTNQMMSVTLRCTHTVGMPKIELLPPEEFLINEGATSINDDHKVRYVGHRQLMYMSDIKAMFPDIDVESLSADNALEYDYETQARHYSDGTYDDFQTDNGQEATRMKEVIESWVRADRNGDEMAEWRHVFTCGQNLLMDEEWYGDIPFASFTFFPTTHKFYGSSVWDKIRDYERSATALLRSEVDTSVMKNTFRVISDPRYINQKDLQTVKHGVIRALPGFDPTKTMLAPSPVGGGNATPILEIIRMQIIAEIGIDPTTGQISVDVEKSGNDATKTAMVIDNASAKIESYAREFADNTLRDVIWQIVKLLAAHADEPSVKQLAMSTSGNPDFLYGKSGIMNVINKSDLSAKVGLGHMTGQQKVAATQSLLQAMVQLSSDPTAPLPVPPEAKIELMYELGKGWGYENPELLFGTKQQVMQLAQQAEQQKQQAMQMQQQQVQIQQQQLQMQQQQVNHQMQLAEQNQLFNQQLQQAQHDADLKMKSVEAEEKLSKTGKIEAETRKLDVEAQIGSLVGAEGAKVTI